ncbi:MAG TPA: bluetail domain-containing putative surface protein [Rhizomicrobium sp.]|nr:bluetail domain-containing putative surface protein [Rhizomicrobium sp.]
MAKVNGTAGNDFIHVKGDGESASHGYVNINKATSGADTINIGQGGNDTVFAGDGDDIIAGGAAITAADQLNGQGGNDTLKLEGDYSAGLTFGATSLVSIDKITLAKGFSYNLTLNNANTTVNGATFTVDGTALGKSTGMTVDGTAETNAILAYYAGAGDDMLKGGMWGNGYELSTGGNDTAIGTAAVDYFFLGGALTAKDKLSGGGGFGDRLYVDGDYSAGVKFNATTVVDVSTMYIAAGHNYNFTLDDATISAGRTMTIDGSLLTAANTLTINDAVEKSAGLTVTAGAGDDVITGGKVSLVVDLSKGGDDIVIGGAGHEQLFYGATFNASDSYDGGSGGDDLVILGVVGSQTLNLTGAMMKNVGTLQMNGGSYTITLQDSVVGAGRAMNIISQGYSGSAPFVFDGSAETNGMLNVTGGLGSDTLTGGAGNDVLKGVDGKDILTPGGGSDILLYGIHGAAESTSVNYDVIVGFDFDGKDHFDLPGAVTGIDAKLASGTLSTASFDTDLAARVTAAKLAAGHAVLFTPDHGTLAGHTFLVVDANGTAGYQASADFVFELVTSANQSKLDTADFM